MFRTLRKVWEATAWWRIDHNAHRPHDALRDHTPSECMETLAFRGMLSKSANHLPRQIIRIPATTCLELSITLDLGTIKPKVK